MDKQKLRGFSQESFLITNLSNGLNDNPSTLITLFDRVLQFAVITNLIMMISPLFAAESYGMESILSADESRYLEQKGAITICIDPDWMPLEGLSEDGKHIGISGEYFNQVRALIGIPIQLLLTSSWRETLEKAYNRECDLISLAIDFKERREYLNFTHPFLRVPNVLVTREKVNYISNINQLSNKTLAIAADSPLHDALMQRYPDLKCIEVESSLEGLNGVRSGDYFGYIDSAPTVAALIQREGMFDLTISASTKISYELGMAIRNDEPQLLAIMNKVIKQLGLKKAQEIYNRWVPIQSKSPFDYTLFWQMVITFCFLSLFVFYRYQKIAQLNRQLAIANDELNTTHEVLQQQADKLGKLAITDPLTRLYNRMKIDNVLEQEERRFHRYGEPLSLIMLDVDHFKGINDTHGHLVGDLVLEQLAKIVSSKIRETDFVGRWGGEEFIIVCPSTALDGTRKIADSLCSTIAQTYFSQVGHVTISLGIAAIENDETISKLVGRADEALYRAKDDGRNCVRD